MCLCDDESLLWVPSYREGGSSSLEYEEIDDNPVFSPIAVSRDGIKLSGYGVAGKDAALFITADDFVYLRLNWARMYKLSTPKLTPKILNYWRKVRNLILSCVDEEDDEFSEDAQFTLPVYTVQTMPKLMTKGVCRDASVSTASTLSYIATHPSLAVSDAVDDGERYEYFEVEEDDSATLNLDEQIRELFHGAQLLSRSKEGVMLWLYREHLFLLKPFINGFVWLAEEQSFLGEPPLWLSDFSHVVSPVYELSELRKHINAQTGFSPHCILLLSGEAQVIDAEYVFEQWENASVHVCSHTEDTAGEHCSFVNHVVDECIACAHSSVSLDVEDINVLSHILH